MSLLKLFFNVLLQLFDIDELCIIRQTLVCIFELFFGYIVHHLIFKPAESTLHWSVM